MRIAAALLRMQVGVVGLGKTIGAAAAAARAVDAGQSRRVQGVFACPTEFECRIAFYRITDSMYLDLRGSLHRALAFDPPAPQVLRSPQIPPVPPSFTGSPSTSELSSTNYYPHLKLSPRRLNQLSATKPPRWGYSHALDAAAAAAQKRQCLTKS